MGVSYTMSGIIAVKKRGLLASYIVALVASIVMIVFPIVYILFVRLEYAIMFLPYIILIVGGIAVFIWCIVDLCRYGKTPAVMLQYNGNLLIFANFSCYITEVLNIKYRLAPNKYRRSKWGTLTIVLKTGTVKLRYVDEVENAYYILFNLVNGQNSANLW